MIREARPEDNRKAQAVAGAALGGLEGLEARRIAVVGAFRAG